MLYYQIAHRRLFSSFLVGKDVLHRSAKVLARGFRFSRQRPLELRRATSIPRNFTELQICRRYRWYFCANENRASQMKTTLASEAIEQASPLLVGSNIDLLVGQDKVPLRQTSH